MTVAPATPKETPDTQVSMREVPWMKLGKLTDTYMTAAEAAEASGLDFTVSFYPVEYTEEDGTRRKFDARRVAARTDTKMPLDVVSADYEPLQYVQAFDFMDAVNPTYVAAGALRGGRQGFMVVQAPVLRSVNLLGEDPHDLYVVLRTSHDRTRAVEAVVMPLRGKCMNMLTLRGFSTESQYRIAIKHSSGLHEKLQEAQKVLTNLDTYVKELDRTATRLVERQVTPEQADVVLKRVIRDRPRRDEAIKEILSMCETSATVGYPGTGWGLVNAVSEYYDWGRARGSATSRFLSAMQGQTHTAINRTAALLLSRSN